MDQPVTGQRWISDNEPELGLGIVLKAEYGRIEIFFPAAGEHRQYALKTAPLRRVRFKEGDQIKTHEGLEQTVLAVEERSGLLFYQISSGELPEAGLSDSISFSTPEDRLLAGVTDELDIYDLRIESLQRRSELRQSPVRGYVGSRVDLLTHQMSIVGEVSSRLAPRVLLADEVGLGKTIEAALILHRLHLTGRAERVLILVPEALVHQWFVELFRRFHLLFSLFDEERCAAIDKHDAPTNPFLDSQLIITSLSFLTENTQRAQQAVEAGWDLLIVDEAHHLEWTPEQASPSYTLVESLAAGTPSLLLLTATPQQLGPEGHFARLRLLDPDRYADLAQFTAESERYMQVAQAADRLLDGGTLTKTEAKLFGTKSLRIAKHSDALNSGDTTAREVLVKELIDEFGTGRVMFRNTRAALTGFPERKAILYPLKATDDESEALEQRIKWLAKLLKELGEEKVLLICRTRQMVETLFEQLQREIVVSCELFHEGLTMLQRDRNAAHFAEEEEGARILLCSEIGSEGRNFQFAHHLVLFDLPENPELLEQRIGRLDRIGQTSVIHIHVPYQKASPSEALARWYHEGLDAFQLHPHGASEILRQVEEDRQQLLEQFDAKKLTALIKKTKLEHKRVGKKLEQGHDRLLELSSCRPEQAAEIISRIREQDEDGAFELFFLRVLDLLGMQVEDLSHRTYLLTPGALMDNALPGIPAEGLSVTFDRTRALSRENTAFLSGDHPLVRAALDTLLGSESGNSAFAMWKDSGEEGLLLEASFVAECVAPSSLHADRFMAATPVDVRVDHAMSDKTDFPELEDVPLGKGTISKLLDRGVVKKKVLPGMLREAKKLAETRLTQLVEAAMSGMKAQLENEIERLEDLQAINDHVRPGEITALREQMTGLEEALSGTRLRLDALRLIWRTP